MTFKPIRYELFTKSEGDKVFWITPSSDGINLPLQFGGLNSKRIGFNPHTEDGSITGYQYIGMETRKFSYQVFVYLLTAVYSKGEYHATISIVVNSDTIYSFTDSVNKMAKSDEYKEHIGRSFTGEVILNPSDIVHVKVTTKNKIFFLSHFCMRLTSPVEGDLDFDYGE